MLRKLRRIPGSAPLLFLILLVWLLLTVLSVIGPKEAYREYSTEHGKLPRLSVVMRGIHDHVYPWSGAHGADSHGDSGKTSGEGASQEAPAAEPAAGGAAEDESVETAQAQAAEDAEAQAKAAEEARARAEAKAKAMAQAEEEAKARAAAEALKVPDTSCSEVVPAKDYGVANKKYLSPDDTVYNTDTEGLFATNGTYYSLQQVDDSYFADALMIGDSRTVGLYEYGDMGNVTSFLAKESVTIYDLFDDDKKLDYTEKGNKTKQRSVKGLLSKKQFGKIYISVGVNELGIPDTKDYYNEFRDVITKINKLQPDAIIYSQGIMHVSKKMSSKDQVYNNRAIVQRNQAISTLANGRNIFYIDMNADLCDKNGDLKEELTGDGIHLKASACSLWHEFLLKNAIVIPKPETEAEKETSAAETPAAETAPAETTPAAPAETAPAAETPAETAPAQQ